MGRCLAAASLALGGVLVALLDARSRPVAPLLAVAAATLFMVTRGPVYGPLRFPLWLLAFRENAAVATALSGAQMAFAAGSFAAVVAITAIRRPARLHLVRDGAVGRRGAARGDSGWTAARPAP